MDGERLAGVARARRSEPTRRGPALHRPLVPIDGPDQSGRGGVGAFDHDGFGAHRPAPELLDTFTPAMVPSIPYTSSRSSSNVRSAEQGRAPTSSQPWGRSGDPATDATTARRRRRTRLRTTARADRPTDGVRDPRRHDPGLGEVPTPEGVGAGFDAMAGQTLEFSPLVQSTDRQADSRARPFSRRALMIARPARVLMRARNPCLRARRRVLGWKVRFKAAPRIHGWQRTAAA